jgi:hypothetical protein
VKFKPGDLVLIVGTPDGHCQGDIGKVGTIKKQCDCVTEALINMFRNLSYYQLNGFPNHCYREDALKKIDGDREKAKTDETRDAPVAA